MELTKELVPLVGNDSGVVPSYNIKDGVQVLGTVRKQHDCHGNGVHHPEWDNRDLKW